MDYPKRFLYEVDFLEYNGKIIKDKGSSCVVETVKEEDLKETFSKIKEKEEKWTEENGVDKNLEKIFLMPNFWIEFSKKRIKIIN